MTDNSCYIPVSGSSEAIADVDHCESPGCVPIPSWESVEIAKAWVEENEK